MAEWGKAADRDRDEGRGRDKAEVAWAVILRGGLPKPACVRNVGTVNRTKEEGHAFRNSAQSAGLRWSVSEKREPLKREAWWNLYSELKIGGITLP